MREALARGALAVVLGALGAGFAVRAFTALFVPRLGLASEDDTSSAGR